RHQVERVWIARMNRRGEAEAGREAGLDALPAATAVITAVHAAVVLLIEPVRHSRRRHEAVHALPELRITLVLRIEVGARAAVTRLPGLASVGSVEDARRRDRHPKLLLVLRVRHQTVEDEPGAARLPLRPRRMVAQAGQVVPRCAAVVAAEQPCRLHPGIKGLSGTPGRRRQAPHHLDRLLLRRVAESLARVRPAFPEVGGLPYGRAEPLVSACRIDRATRAIADDMVDWPGIAEGAAEAPGRSRGVARQDECALLRADQQQNLLAHLRRSLMRHLDIHVDINSYEAMSNDDIDLP